MFVVRVADIVRQSLIQRPCDGVVCLLRAAFHPLWSSAQRTRVYTSFLRFHVTDGVEPPSPLGTIYGMEDIGWGYCYLCQMSLRRPV